MRFFIYILLLCISIALIIAYPQSSSSITLHLQNPCPKGITYEDDCNTCTCDYETRVTTCTAADCTPQKSSFSLCPKGISYYEDECNTCSCDEKTGLTTCEAVDCSPPLQKPQNLCPLGESYYEEKGCLDCKCTLSRLSNGGTSSSTQCQGRYGCST